MSERKSETFRARVAQGSTGSAKRRSKGARSGSRAATTLRLGSVREAGDPERPKVAFIGLGAMGRRMAGRLLGLGFDVRVFNRTALADSPMRALRDATTASSPRECAVGADIVVAMVSDGDALKAVLEGPKGVLAAFANERRRPRPILVDMSTSGRQTALYAAKRAEESGARFVDAPVSGSLGPAARGELVALAGGSVRSVERARPVLEALCRRVIHAGGVGQGQALKVVLNGLGAHHLVAFTSMLALGERAGLARDILLDAFTSGAFATPSYLGKRDKVLARNYAPEFSLALTLKDCRLAVDLARELGLVLPVARAVASDVEAGVKEGLGELDLFALEKHYARR